MCIIQRGCLVIQVMLFDWLSYSYNQNATWPGFIHTIAMFQGFFDVLREMSYLKVLQNGSIPKNTKERKLTVMLDERV